MTISDSSNKALLALELTGAVELEVWRKSNGICRTTAWNWRRTGKLKVIYRYGRAYVSAEESRHVLATIGAAPENGTITNLQ